MIKNNTPRMKESTARARLRTDSDRIVISPAEVEFHSMTETLERERQERARIVLWRQPVLTFQYFLRELLELCFALSSRLYQGRRAILLTALLMLVTSLAYYIEGAHQKVVKSVERKLLWCAYWLGLGILSSVGLGTGLHTFLLYLGPHIAAVTLAAYECKSVNFPEPPYPTEIGCPLKQDNQHMSVWTIMNKVRLESIMWGAGTAIGELPPYFMARAARLSGTELEDDDFKEIQELLHEKTRHPEEIGILEKAKLSIHNLVQRVGFFGILACASIPNPLFDLAGITCGHFLIPFWTFFGATLIGKAIIKMHIQKLFVIFVFSAHNVEKVIKFIGFIPYFGRLAQQPFQEYLEQQKMELHHGAGQQEGGGNILSWCFDKLVFCMVIYFIVSIFNSMAQGHHKRLCKSKRVSRREH